MKTNKSLAISNMYNIGITTTVFTRLSKYLVISRYQCKMSYSSVPYTACPFGRRDMTHFFVLVNFQSLAFKVLYVC